MPHPQFRVCCERSDGTKYKAACGGCPQAQLITKSVELVGELCGNDEFQPSAPPQRYRLRTYDYRETVTIDPTYYYCRTSSSLTLLSQNMGGRSFIDTFTREYDLMTCDQTTADGPEDQGWTFEEDDPLPECAGTLGPMGNGPLTNQIIGSNTWQTDSPTSRSYSWQRIDEWGGVSQSFTINGQLETVTSPVRQQITARTGSDLLSQMDTITDALDRAVPVSGNSLISSFEERTAATVSFIFTKRTVDYAILLTGLEPGSSYEGEIPIQSGTAVAGVSTMFSDDTPDTFNFTALENFHIEGGTLNSSISDQDFIDNGYSLDPTDYGLTVDDDVIIPAEPLDHNLGMAYRLGMPTVEQSS
ncbi:MAG: hypothetical protein AAF065_11855 [Verrucomicrobiota bacterium]